MTLTEEQKEEMIGWLCIFTPYAREYWEKQTDEHIKQNYTLQMEDNAL